MARRRAWWWGIGLGLPLLALALLLMLALLRPAPVVRVLTGWPPPDWDLVACDHFPISYACYVR